MNAANNFVESDCPKSALLGSFHGFAATVTPYVKI